MLHARSVLVNVLVLAGVLWAGQPVNGAVIYSGVVNIATNTTSPTTAFINIDGTGNNELRLVSAVSAIHRIDFFQNGFGYQAASSGALRPDKYASGGAVTGPGSIFSIGNGSFTGAISTADGGFWANGDDAFFGFGFNPSGGLVLYGWAHVKISGDGTTMTLVDWAFDNSGAGLTVGVPEPSVGAVLLLACAGGMLVRRRR